MSRSLSRSRWWVIVLLAIGIALVVIAVAWRERPLALEALPPVVVTGMREIGGEGESGWESIRYTSRSESTYQGRVFEARIETVLRPLGDGWIARSDDWYDPKGLSAFRQERSLTYRNLASAFFATRELAPFVHDLLGSLGWLYDRTESVEVVRDAGFPKAPGTTLKLLRHQVADSPADSASLRPTRYQRELMCRVEPGKNFAVTLGESDEPAIPVSCRAESEGTRRVSAYLFVPRFGIYLLVDVDEETKDGKFRRVLEHKSFRAR